MPSASIQPEDLAAFKPLVALGAEGSLITTFLLKDAYPIDPATGLPALPSWYFWRIEESVSVRRYLIHLVKHSERSVPRFFGTRQEWEDRVVYSTLILDDTKGRGLQSCIQEAAYNLLAFMSFDFRKIAGPSMADFVGDYPPKRLT